MKHASLVDPELRACARLERSADRWGNRARRSGTPNARIIANVLTALTWAVREGDAPALKALESAAEVYLTHRGDELGARLKLSAARADAFDLLADAVASAVERAAGTTNQAAEAATWFVIQARHAGIALPALPSDDDEAVEHLTQAIHGARKKLFTDDGERAESWLRRMLTASGVPKAQAANALKRRMKKRGNDTAK